jgi:hypothetical protein
MRQAKVHGGRRGSRSKQQTPEQEARRTMAATAKNRRAKWAVTDLQQACALSSAAIKTDGWHPLVGVPIDDETLPFRANLARLNDFGLFTYISQPSGPAEFRGRAWVQRAYIAGYATPETVEQLRQIAGGSDFQVLTDQPDDLVITGDREETVPWAYGATAARDEGCSPLADLLDSCVHVWLLAGPDSDSVFTAF